LPPACDNTIEAATPAGVALLILPTWQIITSTNDSTDTTRLKNVGAPPSVDGYGRRGIVIQMNPLYKQMIGSSVLGTLALIAMVFIPAGTLNYWQGWAYTGTAIGASALYTMYLMKYDPALLQRRQQAGPSHEKEPAQKIIILLIYAAFVALIALPPLDYRFGWSSVPWYVSVVGNALVGLSFYFFYLVSKVNTYAAANVRVEEGQRVIDTGVYGIVRHPMYFGALLLIIGTPLALGSWWTLLSTPGFLLLLYFRIASEEKVLMRDLPGYVEYQNKVKYRLMPFVW
jgi:protein-S-isoprenylcysteine O-methyltransferase Ste14